MTEAQIIKRKILLKRQAVKVIRGEIRELQFKLALTQIRTDLEAQMTQEFEPTLSRKLDCLTYLLEY